jgi:cell shape-determining protein MreD
MAFFSGLFLDILMLGTLGLTSMYFIIFVLMVFLYQKKFEIDNLNLIIVFTFLGGIGYLWLLSASYIIFQAIILTLISGISFLVYKTTAINNSNSNNIYG